MHLSRTILFLLSFIVFLLPGNVSFLKAQQLLSDTKYTFRFSDNTIYDAIDSIRLKTNLGVSFNPDILSPDQKFTASFSEAKLNSVLDSIFNIFNLNYKIIGTTIAISSKFKKLIIQNEDNFESDSVTIAEFSGKVTDKKKNDPLPYANIFLKNRPIGTISNIDGNFILKVPAELVNDTVCFSYIGYKPLSVKISNLLYENNQIALEEVAIRLKEVTVRYIKPDELIKKAIEKIPENYSRIPLLAMGFYREILKENNDYVTLSEAVLKIYKAPYNSMLNDQVSIYKGRKSPFVKQMDTVFFKLQGGIHTNLLLDIAKNHTNFISGENFDFYTYKLEDITSIQGHYAYSISFDQKDYINYPLFKGKIYIDTESLAIIRAEFMLSPKGINYATETMVRKSPRRVKVRPVEANYLVTYTERNNIWYLSNMREQVKFKVKKKYTLYSKTFESIAEMVITQTDSLAARRFKFTETIKMDDVFIEKIQSYDPSFWGKFNFIEPDESLEQALGEIKEQLKP
jgi:hypothetical protein